MQKLYCYVDESGQDTAGRLFLVAVVILGNELATLREQLEAIEKTSGKGARKWYHTNKSRRENFIEDIIDAKIFRGDIFYSCYKDSKAYFDLTIFSAAKAVLSKARDPYEVTVFVDGLQRSERQRFAAGLRRLNVKVRKVRGTREESDIFVRLADAMAGFVRDHLEGDADMTALYHSAEKRGIIEQL